MSAAAPGLRGVLLFTAGLFFLACMDTTTKYLTLHYGVLLIVAARYIGNCMLMVVVLAPSRGMRLVETRRTGLVLARAACLAVASLFMGLALQRMPVAETTAIVFVAPILVMLAAGPVLDERIGMLGWGAALAGFAGVVLIARPGSGLDLTGVAFVLCAAAATMAYHLLSRVLAKTERTDALLFYTALVGAVCYGALLPWFWEGPAPTPSQLLLFLSLGANGGIGHFLFTAAYRFAPASLLAPLSYLQLLWAGLLGRMAFGHMPDGLTMLGMAVVAASGLISAFDTRQAKRKDPT